MKRPLVSSLPLVGSAALLAAGIAYSCSGESSSTDSAPFSDDRKRVLQSTAECTASLVDEFASSVNDLQAAVSAWANSPEDDTARTDAQAAWRDTMLIWQQAEVAQYGPAGSSGSVDSGGAIGGDDLRDRIYSWSLVNSCRVDQGLVSQAYEGGLDGELVNAVGLDALEYLLFETGDESSCPPTVDIVSDGTWDEVEDLSERRAAYAVAVVAELSRHAETLATAWEANEENFRGDFVQAGEAGRFPSQAEAIDAVVRALLYLDPITKDLKVGEPAGLGTRCAEDACPEEVEHQQAGISALSVGQNVEGFRRIYDGCGEGAFGFDELLVSLGSDAVDAEVDDALSRVDAALEAIDSEDLRDTLGDERDQVVELHAALKELTDVLKNDVVAALQVQLAVVGGDSD